MGASGADHGRGGHERQLQAYELMFWRTLARAA
jgi:hypothetical protein